MPPGRSPALSLRPLTLDDRAEYLALVTQSYDHLAPWLPLLADGRPPESLVDFEIERAATHPATDFRRLAIHDDRIIGAFSIINITRGLTCQGDASWWVGAPYLRRGFARQGLRLLLRCAFDDLPQGLGLNRLIATIAPENAASIKLAMSAGFRRYANEDHHLHIANSWKRHHCYVADARIPAFTELKPNKAAKPPLPFGRDDSIPKLGDA